MKSTFTLEINGVPLEFNTMNFLAPELFQVYVMVDGERKRFHLLGNGIDQLDFVFPRFLPGFPAKAARENYRTHF